MPAYSNPIIMSLRIKFPKKKGTDKADINLRFVGAHDSINHACPIISSITFRILSIVASVAMIGGFISIAGRQFALYICADASMQCSFILEANAAA